MIFLDASVLLAAEDPRDRNNAASIGLLQSGRSVATLDLAAFEVTNVAIRKWGNDESAARLRRRVFAIENLGELIRVDEELVKRSQEIANHHGTTIYDSSYVAAADRAGLPLVSCDEADLVSKGLAVLPADALPE